MTVIYADDFTNTDGTAIGTHDAGWTSTNGGGAGAVTIQSNELSADWTSGTWQEWVRRTDATADSDQTVRFRANVLNNRAWGLIARYTSSTSRYRYRFRGAGNNTFELDGGGLTLQTEALQPGNGTWYWLRLQVIGADVKAKWWEDGSAEPGTWNHEVTDPSPLTDGDGGLYSLVNATDGNRFDDYTLDDTQVSGGVSGSLAETQENQTVAASGTVAGEPQVVRPVATTNAGTWTAVGAATLHEAVDEETATFDDYIRSGDDPQASPVALRLGPLAEPASAPGDNDVVVHVQYDKEGAATTNLTLELRQGYVSEGTPGTLIASTSDSDVTDATENGTISLTAAEAANITYTSGVASDLDIRIVADLT